MELPRRGCLLKADGQIVSAWEFNSPGVLTQPLLIIEDPDGNRINGYDKGDMIIDLTPVTEPGDMAVFYREQPELRGEKDEACRRHCGRRGGHTAGRRALYA